MNNFVVSFRRLSIASVSLILTELALRMWCQFREEQLPTFHFRGEKPPIATARCAECHSDQVDSVAQAPHSMTLRRGNSKEIVATFHGLVYPSESLSRRDSKSQGDDRDDGNRLNGKLRTDRFEFRDGRLWRHSTNYPDPVPVDWIFGSGRHAQTPVSVRETLRGTTEVLEHSLSRYPGIGLDLTLGTANENSHAFGWHRLGNRMSQSESEDCFGCHTTWLPGSEGHLELDKAVTGVQCARCHFDAAGHVSAMSRALRVPSKIERLSQLSPLESIRRCGECHRRDDQLTADELRPDNLLLVRFAPVGLSQSACFREQRHSNNSSDRPLRLDCTTCHDPHRAAESDVGFYIEKCTSCHKGGENQPRKCTNIGTAGNCLECHMSKVEVQPRLRFTDHWIRKREAVPVPSSQK